ncbi:MAG: hypothetical protein QM820_50835 [Minicystis sp.]
MSEREPEPDTLVPVDPERHALEMRIEHAKSRIVEDLNRASSLFREVASRTGRGIGRLALISGAVVAGAILMAIVRMRSRRRIRITWK